MKKSFFTILFIAISGITLAQNFDFLVTTKKVECSDIAYNSSIFFVSYMTQQKYDSVEYLLDYWVGKCGNREPLVRAKILYALKTDKITDTVLNEFNLEKLFAFQRRQEMIEYSSYYEYDAYPAYYGFIPPNQEFDQYTRQLAAELLPNYDLQSKEYLLLEFYGTNSDTILSKIQTGKYNSLKVSKEYFESVESLKKLSSFHMSMFAGAWIPTGQLQTFGNHPEIGFSMGGKKNKLTFDLVISLKFIKSKNDFLARRRDQPDTLYLTNHFFGGYFGIDFARDMWVWKEHELQAIAGLGWNGIDVLEEDKDNDLKSATASSYDFNLGFSYRYFISQTTYLGIKAQYHIVDYTFNDAIDFTGNPITIHLVLGYLENNYRNESLKALRYNQR